MSNTQHAFDFLDVEEFKNSSVIVLFGNESFLKGRVKDRLEMELLGLNRKGHSGEADSADDADINLIKLAGAQVQWNEVLDELDTISLFGGGPRVVYLEGADPFVSEYRNALESYVADGKGHGILVLDVSDWRSNTKLYKAVDKAGLQIDCRLPSRGRSLDLKKIAKWGSQWGKKKHQIKIKPLVVEHMIDLVGPELGILDQNLAKLSLFFDSKQAVDEDAVNEYVGGWQTKTIWDLIENALNGHTGAALTQLDRLMQNGEVPIALYGQMAWSIRRYALAFDEAQRMRRSGKKMNVKEVITNAGFRGWDQDQALRHLKKIGREKGAEYYKILLECDLALKASHSSPPRSRIALEKMIFDLVAAR